VSQAMLVLQRPKSRCTHSCVNAEKEHEC
jgi:hypothetical protein